MSTAAAAAGVTGTAFCTAPRRRQRDGGAGTAGVLGCDRVARLVLSSTCGGPGLWRSHFSWGSENLVGPLFPKNICLGFWDGWGRGLGLGENTVSLGFPERFPTFMGLRKPKEERMGPPDVAKIEL